MKSRLIIFLSIILLVAVLAALNAASYVRVERERETELLPDRSTLNSGRAGTRALFEYLRDYGADVTRWGHPVSALAGPDRPESLVIVGQTRRAIEAREAAGILSWVSAGGRLVVIDREPNPQLLPQVGRWRVFAQMEEYPDADTDPFDAENMTRGAPLLAPAQPTALTRNVAEVTRSRFASRLQIFRADESHSEEPRIVVADPRAPRQQEREATPPPRPTPDKSPDTH
ncbi:MAG TPA: DUF4350 domain-containing protein, partial [Pyrinomonadaceae bacterium]